MPILDSRWYINSEAEHKTAMFKLWHFDLRVCEKGKLTLQKSPDYCSKDATVCYKTQWATDKKVTLSGLSMQRPALNKLE